MVYFIQGKLTGLIKIGHTTSKTLRDARQLRIEELQAFSPDELIVLAVVLNWTRLEELAIHKKFLHLRVHHEWFRPAKDLLDFINYFVRGNPIEPKCTLCGKEIKELFDKAGHQLFIGSIGEAVHPLCFREKEYAAKVQ